MGVSTTTDTGAVNQGEPNCALVEVVATTLVGPRAPVAGVGGRRLGGSAIGEVVVETNPVGQTSPDHSGVALDVRLNPAIA